MTREEKVLVALVLETAEDLIATDKAYWGRAVSIAMEHLGVLGREAGRLGALADVAEGSGWLIDSSPEKRVAGLTQAARRLRAELETF